MASEIENLKTSATLLKVIAYKYKTFARPMLESAYTVWDPHTKHNINRLEAIQR